MLGKSEDATVDARFVHQYKLVRPNLLGDRNLLLRPNRCGDQALRRDSTNESSGRASARVVLVLMASLCCRILPTHHAALSIFCIVHSAERR